MALLHARQDFSQDQAHLIEGIRYNGVSYKYPEVTHSTTAGPYPAVAPREAIFCIDSAGDAWVSRKTGVDANDTGWYKLPTGALSDGNTYIVKDGALIVLPTKPAGTFTTSWHATGDSTPNIIASLVGDADVANIHLTDIDSATQGAWNIEIRMPTGWVLKDNTNHSRLRIRVLRDENATWGGINTGTFTLTTSVGGVIDDITRYDLAAIAALFNTAIYGMTEYELNTSWGVSGDYALTVRKVFERAY